MTEVRVSLRWRCHFVFSPLLGFVLRLLIPFFRSCRSEVYYFARYFVPFKIFHYSNLWLFHSLWVFRTSVSRWSFTGISVTEILFRFIIIIIIIIINLCEFFSPSLTDGFLFYKLGRKKTITLIYKNIKRK